MDREVIRRRDLPHWDVPGAAYFVTTCLEGSIPALGLLDLVRYRNEICQRPMPKNMTKHEWENRCWKLSFARVDKWLDQQPAKRLLENPELAQIVVDSILHFAGERYDLYAFVVMPSHVHWVFQPLESWIATLPTDDRTPRQRIVYSMNRFTATRCNRALRQRGAFWQRESYDHWIRDVDELERIIRYVEENPVKSGLAATPEDSRFSSARLRRLIGMEWGSPLNPDQSHLAYLFRSGLES